MRYDLVVIGGSWGGMRAVEAVLQGLGDDCPAAVVVALHRGTDEGARLPRLLRPLVQRLARRVVVDSTLKAGRFTRKGRAPGVFQPSPTPAPAADVLARVEVAVRGLEADIRSRHPEARRTIPHPIFGALATTAWVRLQAIHVRHHRAQLPAVATHV